MRKKPAHKIFEKYNPADAVVRCPNGRAYVRKQLDSYAKAAVNLYGVIPKTEFVDIFNRQNIDKTTTDELFILLLPLVLKNKCYCFYKDYIVHYWAIDNFDYADYWLMEQSDKPRYIPERDEFLQFEDPNYESEEQDMNWRTLFEFIGKEWPDNYQRYRIYNELKETSKFGMRIQAIRKICEKYRLTFSDDKQAQMFFDLLMEAHNNTRMWSNKGHSPNELIKILANSPSNNSPPQLIAQKRKVINPNDRCPCGSGKKYKKCCQLTEESKTAQLSSRECMLFYVTWFGLMGYINERKKIINKPIKPIYPNPVSDEQIFKVREALWKNPGLIDDYLGDVNLPAEIVTLLKSWRDYHIKGMFFLVDYKPEFAVVLGSNEKKEDRLYGIKGISRSLADAMRREVPAHLETVLLPFYDKIIYDSFISTLPISYGEGAKQAFSEMYENALEHGIITCLG